MNNSFTIRSAELEAGDEDFLRNEIIRATGSETDVASILRSMERLGRDPSIIYYEITRVAGKRMHGGAAPNAWRVRADRGTPQVDG